MLADLFRGSFFLILTAVLTVSVLLLERFPGSNASFWQSLSSEFGNSAWIFGLGLSVTIGAGVLAQFLIGWGTDRSETDLDDVIGNLLRVSVTGVLGAVVLFWARNELPTDLRDLTEAAIAELGKNNLYTGLLVLLATYLAVSVLNRIIVVWLSRLAGRTSQTFDDAFVMLLRIYGGFFAVAIGGGVLIFAFRDEIAADAGIEHALLPYAIVVGTVTALIGILTQESTSNFVNGMMMQIDRPFDPDDRIRLESGEVCQVVEVGIRATRLLDVFENTEISVPNSMIAASQVVNIARPNEQLRLPISLAVRPRDAYRAEAAMLVIAMAHPEVVNMDETEIRDALEQLNSLHEGRFEKVEEELDVYLERLNSLPTIQGRSAVSQEEIDTCVARENEWFARLTSQEGSDSAMEEVFAATKAFERLSVRFFELVADPGDDSSTLSRSSIRDRGSQIRYTREGHLVAKQLATEATVHSEFIQAEDGAGLVLLSLRVYARLFERREEVAHSINREVVKRFNDTGIDVLGVRDGPLAAE
ncbi:MAG: mechanosensitive ion channel domain-containing protein [Acidimicrobiales bacterium]